MKIAGVLSAIVLASASALAAPPEPRSPLPFIENDYPKALAEARAKKKPIFADAWAPW